MSSARTLVPTTRVPEFDVHDRARKARVTAGLDRDALMDLTGISLTSISSIENGKVTPRRSTLMLWALATGVSVDWLISGEEPGNDEAPSTSEGAIRAVRPEGFEPPTV